MPRIFSEKINTKDIFHLNTDYLDETYIQTYPSDTAKYVSDLFEEVKRLKEKCGEKISNHIRDEDDEDEDWELDPLEDDYEDQSREF